MIWHITQQQRTQNMNQALNTQTKASQLVASLKTIGAAMDLLPDI